MSAPLISGTSVMCAELVQGSALTENSSSLLVQVSPRRDSCSVLKKRCLSLDTVRVMQPADRSGVTWKSHQEACC